METALVWTHRLVSIVVYPTKLYFRALSSSYHLFTVTVRHTLSTMSGLFGTLFHALGRPEADPAGQEELDVSCDGMNVQVSLVQPPPLESR